MSQSHFFAHLFRLRYIQRWPLMRNALPEDAAQHSFHVAVLTHALCTIAREVFGKALTEEDVGRAVLMALFHDAEEVITGDIAAPVKHHDAAILQAMRQIEALAAERLLAMVPRSLLPTYRPLIGQTERDARLMAWVKAADTLDALLKCRLELAVGNRDFAVAHQQLQEKVRGLAMPEVEYFLQHFGQSFERTLDELQD
ncbi:MAG TPA: 5'-deoxynucleotidase [Chloroflexota bacterium]|nr:5'-deoxynucleotidase [Chloroflexota bacterium]